ncbi:MAG: hypothetical protein JXA58_01605 [Dehalococcoidia bacterium]|nr:hypothetical protein [Dehalococcoidia bacterium]
MRRFTGNSQSFHALGTELRFLQLSWYLEELASQLITMAEDHDASIEQAAQRIEDEAKRAEFLQYTAEEHWEYTLTFPRILFNSFHVAAYSLLEHELQSLASLTGRKRNQLIDVTDFRGTDYLGNAARYIERTTGVDVTHLDSWQPIDDARRARNIIVHHNGLLLNQSQLELARKCNCLDQSTFDLASGEPLMLWSSTRPYCDNFLTDIGNFLTDLYSRAGEYL